MGRDVLREKMAKFEMKAIRRNSGIVAPDIFAAKSVARQAKDNLA